MWIRSGDIDTRRMWTLSAIFKMATTGVSMFLGRSKIFCFPTSDLQNIHVDLDIQNICGLEVDITIRDTYHIFGQTFCKMAATKVIKMLCVGLLCIKILYLLSVPLKMYI